MPEIGATRNQKITGHLFALFTTLVWGSCFVLTKVMLNAFTPIQCPARTQAHPFDLL